MATFVDRVRETTVSTGTGTVSLAGAVSGFVGFISAFGDGALVYYQIELGAEWEVGIGTLDDASPDTLSRDTILASSNSGSAVDFSAGTKQVRAVIPAAVLEAMYTASYVSVSSIARLPNERILTGTTNQITVTDNGSGSTVVLSLPQNIHTGANVQLATLGLGVAPGSLGTLVIGSGGIVFYKSGFAHGVTNKGDTDAIGYCQPYNATNGGRYESAFCKTATLQCWYIDAIFTDNPNDNIPAFIFDAGLKSGTGVTQLGATKTIIQLRNGSSVTLWQVFGDGIFTRHGGSTSPTLPSAAVDTVSEGACDTAAGQRNFYIGNEEGKKEQISGLKVRVATQFDKTSNTTLSDVTGLSRNVEAGKWYAFRAVLFTTSNIAGGIKAAIGGTATATAIIYEAIVTQAGAMVAPGTTRATALATAVGDVTAVTTARITIEGLITVNAAGTLTVQFAQNASNGAASSVLVGSYLELIPIGS